MQEVFKSLRIGLILGALACAIAAFSQTAGNAQLDALLSKAREAESRQDFAAAAEAYRSAVKLRTDIPELRVNLGIMEYEAGEDQSAAADLAAAIRLKPEIRKFALDNICTAEKPSLRSNQIKRL